MKRIEEKIVRSKYEIFSKEALSIEDIQELLGLSYEKARQIIIVIKNKYDRLEVSGHIHVQDYFDYFKISIDERVALCYEYKARQMIEERNQGIVNQLHDVKGVG